MLQKEVLERMTSSPGSKVHGRLSVMRRRAGVGGDQQAVAATAVRHLAADRRQQSADRVTDRLMPCHRL